MTDARSLTLSLRGKWYGGYGLAFCPAHANRKTPALRLADGDNGRLLAICYAGCTFNEVRDALASLGLMDRSVPYGPASFATLAARLAQEKEDERKRTLQARLVWSDAQPVEGTLAETYLRRRRIAAPLPPTLRFLPDCWHVSARRHPALLAAVIRCGEPRPVAVHRTYLSPDGSKADIEPAKAMLGVVRGGAVPLSCGDGPLVVAEGIETALSLLDRVSARGAGVWATLSSSGMASLRLPEKPGVLEIAPDDDPAGRAAARRLAEKAHWAGWKVSIIEPPAGGLDWNDIAQQEGAA